VNGAILATLVDLPQGQRARSRDQAGIAGWSGRGVAL